MDERAEIPDLPGQILVIQAEGDLEGRTGAFKSCLRRLSEAELSQAPNNKKHGPAQTTGSMSASNNPSVSSMKVETIIFVPEGLVSMVIGSKGRQINDFKEESRAEIVVNQPIIGMNLRSVSIKGKKLEKLN